ncbi:MAG: thiamine diphosphokinase [Chloroflexia bacterium]
MSNPTPANNESIPRQSAQRGPLVWVLASGPVDDPLRAIQGLAPPDIVIAADGGSSLAARLCLVPNLIVGDLDSSEPAIIADFEAQGVEVRRYDHHTKSETDTELAMFAALEWEPSEIVLLGALGGRLDHTLANILLLTNPRLVGTKVRIVDGPEEIVLAQQQIWTEVHGTAGDTVSLLPIGKTATGVKLQGLEYSLDGEPLVQGFARGVSNRLTQPTGRMWVESGLLLVVLTRSTISER